MGCLRFAQWFYYQGVHLAPQTLIEYDGIPFDGFEDVVVAETLHDVPLPLELVEGVRLYQCLWPKPHTTRDGLRERTFEVSYVVLIAITFPKM